MGGATRIGGEGACAIRMSDSDGRRKSDAGGDANRPPDRAQLRLRWWGGGCQNAVVEQTRIRDSDREGTGGSCLKAVVEQDGPLLQLRDKHLPEGSAGPARLGGGDPVRVGAGDRRTVWQGRRFG